MSKINSRNGISIEFEIEQNPEDPTMWGVWEKEVGNPVNDEIVASFPDRVSAQRWIDDKCRNWKQYLKDRGISDNG